ncbi:SGNH hydrolase-type esterase domain-containing protein OS=Streptomyces violarus OX=67380 GN=FHS41_006533 PE=4 SV=1 [Streptomyces violarus]
MAPLIGEAVRSCRADVLLVSLGLIDLGFYTNAEQTAENVRAFAAEARAANRRVRMVWLPVTPNVRADPDPAFAAEVARFNELLAKTAADLDEPGSPRPPGLDPALLRHPRRHLRRHPPNASGEHKIAAAFAEAMYQAWDLGEPYEQ